MTRVPSLCLLWPIFTFVGRQLLVAVVIMMGAKEEVGWQQSESITGLSPRCSSSVWNQKLTLTLYFLFFSLCELFVTCKMSAKVQSQKTSPKTKLLQKTLLLNCLKCLFSNPAFSSVTCLCHYVTNLHNAHLVARLAIPQTKLGREGRLGERCGRYEQNTSFSLLSIARTNTNVFMYSSLLRMSRPSGLTLLFWC